MSIYHIYIYIYIYISCLYTIYIYIPVVPARGGAEVALKIYIRPFSSIELACAVRQPSPCVRALCETGVLFHMSQLKLHVTLHTWQSSHSTLHSSRPTLHLIWALLTLSQLSSSHLISSHMSSKLSWISSQYYYKGTCMRSAPARPVRACFVRSCCSVAVQEHDLRASPVQCNVKQALSSHITLHPSHFTSELFSSGFMSSHMSATFFLAIFMSSERSSNFLMRWSYFQLISALLDVSKVERNSCRFFCMPKGVEHKIFTILKSLMPSVDALHQIATASVNMV